MTTNVQAKSSGSNLAELKEMFQAGLHYGHRVFRWNPKMDQFIFGKQNGVHIFDLATTQEYLDKALSFLGKSFSEGKTILFVGTKMQCQSPIEEVAQKFNMPYITKKWFAGFLTNFKTFRARIKRLKELEEQIKSGEMGQFKKKEIVKFTKEKDKLDYALGGVKDISSSPDLVFVLDAHRDRTVIVEANRKKIPVIAVVDTNADPDGVDYPIPANDDSVSSIEYIMKKVDDTLSKVRAK